MSSRTDIGEVTPGNILLFDGDCAFCAKCIGWMHRWVKPSSRAIAWQDANLDSLNVDLSAVLDAVIWVPAVGDQLAGPAAIAKVLKESPHYWAQITGRVLSFRVTLLFAWPTYRWVSRNRHRLPGGAPECSITNHPHDSP